MVLKDKYAYSLGGVGALAKHLGVGEGLVADWMAGKAVPPADVIVKAVDPLIGAPASFWRDPPKPSDAPKADK